MSTTKAMTTVISPSRSARFVLVSGMVISLVTAFGLPATSWAQATPAEKNAAPPAERPAADDAPPKPVEPKIVDGKIVVPDGTPQEIIEFVDSLRNARKRFANRRAAVEYAIQVQWAIADAGAKILAQKTDDEVAESAAEMQFEALMLLANSGIDGALAAATKAANALKNDPREDLADLAQSTLDELRVIGLPTLPPAERDALLKELIDAVEQSKFSGEAVSKAMQAGDAIESLDDSKIAGAYYLQLSELLKKSGRPRLINLAEQLAGNARRLNLPGNPIDVSGTTLDGQPFDWAKYKGKVVLVDFWATWCGPCRAEMPHVKEMYEKYHPQGFEVVAISLDEDKEALTGFLKDEGIPWVNLFAFSKDGEPQNQPTAEKYGVTSIPTAILVGRDGKVLSLNARGAQLTELLETQFAPTQSPK